MRTALGALLVALTLLVAGPAPAAWAHADLASSIPADGEQLDAPPDDVLLTFNEDLLADTVVVSVEDSAGLVVRVLELQVDGPDVYVTWPPGLTGPDYTVNYRVVSQDGHPVEGSLAFSVDTPAESPSASAATPGPGTASPVTPSPSAAEDAAPASSNAPVLAISIGLGVGIAAGFLYMLLRRRGGRTGP